MKTLLLLALPLGALISASVVFFVSRIVQQREQKKQNENSVVNRGVAFIYVYGRRGIYTLSLLWAFGLFYLVTYSVPAASFALTILMRYFALTALFLLYVVLAPGILGSFFPLWKYNGLLVHVRRSLGVSVFFFAFLHATIGFFNNLSGNIISILFLSPRNQVALAASVTAFCIFSLLALTSFDTMVRRLGRYWKKIHRYIYIAAILVVFHAFLIGSNFTSPTDALPLLVNYLSLTWILLEVGATVKRRLVRVPYVWAKENMVWWIGLTCVVLFGFVGSYVGLTSQYDPHAAHRKGYSKDYVLQVLSQPQHITAGHPVQLTFHITDKRTGRVLKRYQIAQEKLMHVVVLRQDLLSYDHIHPDYDNNGTFTVAHTFPTDGTYYLFVEYSPPDFYENLSIATVTVGNPASEQGAHLKIGEFSKTFDSYKVSLTPTTPLKVNDTVDFTYTIIDAATGAPITNLEPYLAAFGHMSAVSVDLQTYTHVHPIGAPLSAQDRGGPQVRFSTFFPKAGLYKLFTQFKKNGQLFVTDFVVEVK